MLGLWLDDPYPPINHGRLLELEMFDFETVQQDPMERASAEALDVLRLFDQAFRVDTPGGPDSDRARRSSQLRGDNGSMAARQQREKKLEAHDDDCMLE
jgi:hypothetical protein